MSQYSHLKIRLQNRRYNEPMKQVLTRMKNYLPQATQAEEQVIRIMMRNPRGILTMQTADLAKAGYCSPSTVVRLCQKLGFQGLKELKLAVSEELGYAARTNTSTFDESLSLKEMAGMQVELYHSALTQTYALVDFSEVEKAAALISKAPVIHLYGMGASYLVAEDFMMKLMRVKKICCLYHDLHLQMVDANNVGVDEVCMIISYTGQTREMIRAAEIIKNNGGILITLSQYSENRLAALADCRLYVPSTEEGLRVSAGSSRLCQLMMIDILFARILVLDFDDGMFRIMDSSRTLQKLPSEEETPLAHSPLENDLEKHEENGSDASAQSLLEDDLDLAGLDDSQD